MEKFDFGGKTIAITGATGGIANAILHAAAAKGVTMVLHGRDRLELATLASDLERDGAQTYMVLGDLAHEAEGIADEIANIAEIDILVNNAGVYSAGNFLATDLETVRRDVEVNALAALATIQAVLPGMNQRGFGRIVSVSSGGGSIGEGLALGHAAYAISKAAMNAITVLAADAVTGGVKANAMCPGWVRTRMGGSGAPRCPAEGADTALWLASLHADGPNGGFFRDRKPIPW